MPLILITGRANTGKTGILYGEVREAVDAGRRPVVVLPSKPEARRASEEFALRGPVLGVEIATFDDYLASLWSLFGDGRRVVGSTQRRILLARAVEQVPLRVLKRSSGRRGFVRTLERFVQAVGSLEIPAGVDGVARELTSLIAAYGTLLQAAGLVEPSAAAGILSENAEPGWFAGPLIANRFTDLTSAQERFLTAYGRCSHAWLALPWQEGFPATRALTPLVSRLVEAGAKLEPLADTRHTRSDELAYLESHLFLPPEQAMGAPRLGDIRLSQAFGEEAEADRIAAEVLLAIAAGTPASRIAVVYHDPSRSARALRRAFADAGIPAEFHVLDFASRSGWGRALSHLVTFALGGSRADLIAFARVPYSGVARRSAEQAEAYWRRNRVTGFRELVADLGRLGGEAPRIVREAVRLASRTVDAASVGDWQHLVDNLLRNASAQHTNSSRENLAADAAAHRAFMRVLGEIAAMPDAGLVVREMLEVFGDEKIMPAEEAAADLVQVVSAQRARSRRFDVVIVGGLNLGDFPPRRTEDALSCTEVAGALLRPGVDLGRMGEQDAQRLLFYLVVSRATERLVLSRQVTDSDGHDLSGSWLLEELLDLYRTPGAEAGDKDVLPTRTLSFDDRTLSDGAPPTRRRELRERVASRQSVPSNDGDGERLAEARRRSIGRSGGLADPRALSELSTRDVFSVTEIEAYLRCPYGWFYERVVKPRPLGEEVGALLTGRLAHSTLERFYRHLPQRTGDARVTALNLRQATELAAEALDEVLAGEASPQSLLDEAAFASVRERVLGFVQAEAHFLPGYVPVALEQQFDTRETPVALLGDFHLRGRIDRIDRGPTGQLVVTDYKTGRVDATLAQANFEKNGRVQLALYALIAEALFGEPVVAAFYRGVAARNLQDKGNRGFFDPEYVDGPGLVANDRSDEQRRQNIVAEALSRATEAVSGMRAGAIAPQPLSDGACKHCSARGFCGGGHR